VTRRAAVRLLALVALSAAGCGYHAIGYEGLSRQDVETVAVPVVANATFDRGMSEPLTAAVVREVEARTPYRIADASFADTLLEVTITGSSVGTLSRDDRTGFPEQQTLALTVDFVWTDLRTGRELLAVEGFTQTADYFATLGEGRSVPRREAAQRLAEGIVDELSGRW
jgi:hypothetical protein